MFKRFAAGLFLLSVMCGVSWGAEFDPYQLHFWYTSPDYEAQVYNRYGNSDYNFFYQLRDVTGASRREQVAGPQWFATVYENYYYGIRNAYSTATSDTNVGIYRRTMGGETPDITIQTVGDLLDGFNFVFAEEPQPYASAWRRYVRNEVYDVYPDPVESLCLVITNGQGEFNVSFGNPYARHFPFWWDFGTSRSNTSTKWWLQGFDWRDETYPTQEPIAYIFSSPDIYTRNNSVGRYEKSHRLTLSGDNTIIVDTTGKWLYTVSGDGIYTSGDVLTWSVNASRDKVYDASGNLAYTIETDSNSDMFICEIRSVNESITFSDFDGSYSLTVNPSAEQAISSGNSLNANVRVRGMTPSLYGSVQGYISFRQRATLATGYTNYREITSIPLVIANVAEGNASVNPLMFDMIVFNGSDVVNRIKFTWDAQADNPGQDLGTFFMIGSRDVTYQLETRITNRTGTRYELYRYDMTGTMNGTPTYRDGYNNIMPDYWKYDLTEDMYGTLPETFLLDAHSQIAPGLVTVYKNNIGEGYRTISTENDTSESFRLYEYASGTPRNLRLSYKRIGGMTPIEGGNHTPAGGVNVREFMMDFADVAHDSNETAIELFRLTGKYPAMIGRGPLIAQSRIAASDYGDDADPAEVSSVYINSTAVDAFRIVKTVPDGLVRLTSADTGTTASDDATVPAPTNPVSGDASFAPSEVVYTSTDIPLQPVSIRMVVPRSNRLIVNHWDEMNSASDSAELFRIFSRYGTVWVRAENTGEKDANLFSAIGNKGSGIGVGAGDCVRAFLYNDALYLDFIVIMADGSSVNTGKTAYVGVFKDDNVPYVLIGDGDEDGKWELTFYIDSSAERTAESDTSTPSTPAPTTESVSSSGGGGCSSAGAIFAVMLAGIVMRKKR